MNLDFMSNEACFDCFVSGMKVAGNLKDRLKTTLEEYDDALYLDSPQFQFLAKPQIKINSEEMKIFFQNLSKQSDVVCIEPRKLYYTVIKPGTGKAVTEKTTKISINYLISDIDGVVLEGSYGLAPAPAFETKELIQGVAHGVCGMKQGEIRDVFIHQDFSFGRLSDADHGKALRVRLELVEVGNESEDSFLTELIPFDFQNITGERPYSKAQLDELIKKHVVFCGLRTWVHYKKAEGLFSFDEILNLIRQIHSNNSLLSLDESDRKALRQLNNVLYEIK